MINYIGISFNRNRSLFVYCYESAGTLAHIRRLRVIRHPATSRSPRAYTDMLYNPRQTRMGDIVSAALKLGGVEVMSEYDTSWICNP